jgi:hypothetical protein
VGIEKSRALGNGAHAIEAKQLYWKPDPNGDHKCGPACWASLGAVCQCECKGTRHGSLMLQPIPPATPAEMDELFTRLEGPAPYRKGDGADYDGYRARHQREKL